MWEDAFIALVLLSKHCAVVLRYLAKLLDTQYHLVMIIKKMNVTRKNFLRIQFQVHVICHITIIIINYCIHDKLLCCI